jgi:hypothetical protein
MEYRSNEFSITAEDERDSAYLRYLLGNGQPVATYRPDGGLGRRGIVVIRRVTPEPRP